MNPRATRAFKFSGRKVPPAHATAQAPQSQVVPGIVRRRHGALSAAASAGVAAAGARGVAWRPAVWAAPLGHDVPPVGAR